MTKVKQLLDKMESSRFNTNHFISEVKSKIKILAKDNRMTENQVKSLLSKDFQELLSKPNHKMIKLNQDFHKLMSKTQYTLGYDFEIDTLTDYLDS